MTNWERLKMFEFHEFAWFPKIKTLTASYFLKNNNFFLIFEKKLKFSSKFDDFVKNAKLSRYIFFVKKKTLFRNRICHKILKFSSKIRQIRDLQRRTTSKNQCECFFVFFVFRKNIYTQRVFWICFFKKNKKYTKKCVKLIKITKIQALWTCLERLIQARINLMVF